MKKQMMIRDGGGEELHMAVQFVHHQNILGKLVSIFEKLVHRITADKRYALCAMDLETRTDPNSYTLIKCLFSGGHLGFRRMKL
jgi:hypothetical protein